MASETIATARSRRANAGNRMSKLLNEEEDEKDDFYETAYDGKFKDDGESDEDNDYKLEKEEEDLVDSDFDIDENVEDEQAAGDDEEGDKRRTRRVVTKAYKEPVAKRPKPIQKRSKEADQESEEEVPTKRLRSASNAEAGVGDETLKEDPKRGKKRRIRYASGSDDSDFPEYEPVAYEPEQSTSKKAAAAEIAEVDRLARLSAETKLVRSSTKLKSMETEERVKKRTKDEAQRREYLSSRRVEYEMPTQEELMEETKITELLNMESLARFQEMELEKKKSRPIKAVPLGPRIRYHSVTMPDIVGGNGPTNRPLIEMIDDDQGDKEKDPQPQEATGGRGVHERTFISFSDETVLKEAFEKLQQKPEQRETRYCALTKLRTAYYDPVTRAAYYNKDVFKLLRAAYNRVLYQKGDRKNPVIQKYCRFLEQEFPDQFNKEKLEGFPLPGLFKHIESVVDDQNLTAEEGEAMDIEESDAEAKEMPAIESGASASAESQQGRPSEKATSSASEASASTSQTSASTTSTSVLRPTLAKPLIAIAKSATPVRLPTASSLLPVKTYPAKTAAGASTSATTSVGTTTTTAAGDAGTKQVLVARKSAVGSAGDSTTQAFSPLTTNAIRGPIVIRSSVPSQLSQRIVAQGAKPGGVIAVSNSPTGGLQVGGTPLTLVNIRRDGPAAVFRAGIPPGLNQMSPNQVVRLLQSQKIQILQPTPTSLQQSSTPTTGGATGQSAGAVTVRLPASAASGGQVVLANATTASALVANASGVRPVPRALLTSLTGGRAGPGSPTMVLARSASPLVPGDASRLVKPMSAANPQRLPANIRTMTASQLKNVLSSGVHVVKTTPTTAVAVTSGGAVRSGLAPAVRAITVTTRQPGAATTMASAMVRPAMGAGAGTRVATPSTSAAASSSASTSSELATSAQKSAS